MKTERKFPAPTGCREYLILIQFFIFGYILSDYRAIGCDNLRPSPGVWPATSSYVFGQRLEARFQPFRQFGLVIKTIGRALKSIPDIPTVVTQIPIAHPIVPKLNLRHIVRNRRHTCQIKQASSQNSQVRLVNGIAQILVGIFVDGGECIFENPTVRNRIGRNNGRFRHDRVRTSFTPLFGTDSFCRCFLFASRLTTPKPTEKPFRKIGRTAQAEKVKSGHAKSCGDKQDKRQPKRKSPRNHGTEQNDQSKNHSARHDQAKTFLEIILGIHSYDSLKKSSSITTFRNRSRNSVIRTISRSYGSESP